MRREHTVAWGYAISILGDLHPHAPPPREERILHSSSNFWSVIFKPNHTIEVITFKNCTHLYIRRECVCRMRSRAISSWKTLLRPSRLRPRHASPICILCTHNSVGESKPNPRRERGRGRGREALTSRFCCAAAARACFPRKYTFRRHPPPAKKDTMVCIS